MKRANGTLLASLLILLLGVLRADAQRLPIMQAAMDGDSETVLSAIDADPSLLELRDEEGASPLYYAAWHGHADLVQALVDRGAEVRVTMVGGLTPLHWAAVDGHLEVCRILIEHGADVNARSTVQANTPLHEVWNYGGHEEIAALLIEHGADMDAVENWYGMTPLHYAADKNLPRLVEVLVAHGASLEVKDRWGRTPIALASSPETRAAFASATASAEK